MQTVGTPVQQRQRLVALFASALVSCGLATSVAFVVAVPASLMVAAAPAYAAGSGCNARDNLDENASVFISRCKQGGIRNDFPGECLERTLGEIQAGSDAVSKHCWKLLDRKKYDKDAQAPQVTPAYQEAYLAYGGHAYWSVTVQKDPNYQEELVVEFGDGKPPARITIPQGTGSMSVPVEHVYDPPAGGGVGGGVSDPPVNDATDRVGSAYLDDLEVDGFALVAGLAYGFFVHVC